VALFRRKANEQQADETDVEQDIDVEEELAPEAEAEASDQQDIDEPDIDEQPEGRLPRPFDLDRANGPFDRDEVKDLEGRLDFGAVAIIPETGMELRLDVDEAGQEITGLTAVTDDAACQVQAFAAPKTRGVWDAIRDEIADNLISGGGTAEEKLGPLGIELHTRMPARGADGRTTYAPARFIGVDGPRWFLRAVLSGNAALEEEAGDQMVEFLRRTVITRGGEPRAPREMLPLQIPQDVQATATQDPNAAPDRTGDRSDTASDFKPFERGPEITEVR
jgi:hypothetical protein